MAESGSHYPISQFLIRLVEEIGLSRSGFVQSLGYRKIERGRRRLDPWIDEGQGFYKIIGQIAKTYPSHADDLQTALNDTKALKGTEAEAKFLELCKAQEAIFRPFIYAVGERTVPSGICIFGLTGGHESWTIITIPQSILALSLEEQLTTLPELMLGYRRKYDGQVPFFGRLTGFRFVRLIDHFQFDADAKFVQYVEKPFRPGACWVELR